MNCLRFNIAECGPPDPILVCYLGSGAAATRIANQDGVWRPTLSDIKAAAIHGKSDTISEKLVYRKFIKDSEFETREVFEQEDIEECENIKKY